MRLCSTNKSKALNLSNRIFCFVCVWFLFLQTQVDFYTPFDDCSATYNELNIHAVGEAWNQLENKYFHGKSILISMAGGFQTRQIRE